MSIRPLPIVATKLSPPKLAGASLRPDILSLIQRGGQRRLLVVQAPAGYGKTTAVAEAARVLNWRVAWYKLDILDQDPVVFAASLVEAVRLVLSNFGAVLQSRLADAHDAPLDASELLGILAAEFNNEVDGDLHLVLDDYHETANSPDLNTALDYLLASMPSNVHTVVLSRYEPSFRLSRYRLAQDLLVLEGEHLRFTPDQVQAYLAARGLRDLHPTHLDYVLTMTEGWPAGVALVADALAASGQRVDEAVLADPFLKGDLYTYLAEQVYATQDADTQSFLRQSAALEHMTPELAEAVTCCPKAGKTLERLATQCLFTFRTEANHYRYHRLFREYLKHKALQEDGIRSFQEAQLRAAHALEEAGDFSAATEMLLTLREHAHAARVLCAAGEQGLDSCTTATLASWADRMADSDTELQGWRHLLIGLVDFREGRHHEAATHFALSVRAFDSVHDLAARYQATSALERCLYWSGEYQQAAEMCLTALEQAVSPLHTVHSLTSRAAALIQAGRLAPARECLRKARTMCESVQDIENARIAAQEVTLAYYDGQFRHAHVHALAYLGLVNRRLPPSFQIAYLHIIGMLNLQLGYYSQVDGPLREAREIASRLGYWLCEPHILDTEGQLQLALGNADKGIAILYEADSSDIITNDHTSSAIIKNHIATAYRRSNSLISAEEASKKALRLAIISSNPYVIQSSQLNIAYCRSLRIGIVEKETFQEIIVTSRTDGLLSLESRARLYRSILEWKCGNRELAVHHLHLLLPQMIKWGQVHTIVQELALHVDLLLQVIPAFPRGHHLRDMLSAWAQHPRKLDIFSGLLGLDGSLASLALETGSASLPDNCFLTLASRARRHHDARIRRQARFLVESRRIGKDDSALPELTKRENEVLCLVAQGLKNQEIAEQLVVTPGTVKTYINRIFYKLGVSDRVSAVLVYGQRTKSSQQSAMQRQDRSP